MRRVRSKSVSRNLPTQRAAVTKQTTRRRREAPRKTPVKLTYRLTQRIRRWHWAAAIPATTFVLLGVAMIWTAWFLCPASQPMPPRADPVMASVVAKQKINALSITISDPIVSSSYTSVTVYGEADGAVAAGQSAEVYIAVPDVLLIPQK